MLTVTQEGLKGKLTLIIRYNHQKQRQGNNPPIQAHHGLLNGTSGAESRPNVHG